MKGRLEMPRSPRRSLLVLAFLAVMTSGCASPATVQNMVLPSSEIAPAVKDAPYAGGVTVVAVYGGKETNPLWTSQVSGDAFKEALIASLKQSGWVSPEGRPPSFEVRATLGELGQPVFGFNFTVNSRVRYEVLEAKSRQLLFDREILASYTAAFSDSILGTERLRLANEGSIKENIRQFIEALAATPLPQG